MTKSRTFAVAAVLTLGLSGCMGAGLLARTGAKSLFGEKEKPPAERIAAAQEEAIAAVHGGSPDVPIAWHDAKSGVQGTLIAVSGGDIPAECRLFQQTVILAGETLQGRVVACSQASGAWKLSDNRLKRNGDKESAGHP
jgi:surface antigen